MGARRRTARRIVVKLPPAAEWPEWLQGWEARVRAGDFIALLAAVKQCRFYRLVPKWLADAIVNAMGPRWTTALTPEERRTRQTPSRRYERVLKAAVISYLVAFARKHGTRGDRTFEVVSQVLRSSRSRYAASAAALKRFFYRLPNQLQSPDIRDLAQEGAAPERALRQLLTKQQ